MPWIQIIPTTSTDHRYRSNNCNAVNHSDISRSTATFDKIVFVVYYCRKFVVALSSPEKCIAFENKVTAC